MLAYEAFFYVTIVKDAYNTLITCDKCHMSLTEDWWACGQCQNYYNSFDLCQKCYSEDFPEEHIHIKEEFLIIHMKGRLHARNLLYHYRSLICKCCFY
jgi:hypothetical protein